MDSDSTGRGGTRKDDANALGEAGGPKTVILWWYDMPTAPSDIWLFALVIVATTLWQNVDLPNRNIGLSSFLFGIETVLQFYKGL